MVLSLLLLSGEAAVRLTTPAFARQLFDEGYTGGEPLALNAAFFRGPLLTPAKAANEQRVLALGDSTTFGTGVAAEQTYIAALGPVLAQQRRAPVSVLNGGLEGASLRDLQHAYQTQWAAYAPDAVIIGLSPNMVSLALIQPANEVFTVKDRYGKALATTSVSHRLKLWTGRALHSLALPSWLSRRSQQLFYWLGVMNHNLDPKRPYGALLAYGYRQGDLPAETAEAAWQLFRRDLTALVKTVQGDGRRVVLTLIEPRFLLSNALSDNQKNVPIERFSIDALSECETLAASLGVPLVASRRVLMDIRARGDKAEFYLLLDYAHLNPAGHLVLAKALAPQLSRAD